MGQARLYIFIQKDMLLTGLNKQESFSTSSSRLAFGMGQGGHHVSGIEAQRTTRR